MVRGFLRRRPWVWNAIVAGFYALVAVVLAISSATPPLYTPSWISGLLLVAGLAVVLDRRRPVLAFAAAMVLFPLSLAAGTGAESIIAVVTLYRVGVYRSPAVAWACFAVAAIVGGLASVILIVRARTGRPFWEPTQVPISPDPISDWLNFALIIVVPLLIAVLFGTNTGHRRRYVATLVDRAAQLARERDQQAEIATARERERIAREMHDVIAHSLSVMIALTEGAYAAAPDRPEQSRDAVLRAAETGRRTLGEVRLLLGTVSDDSSDPLAAHAPQPDASALPELVEEFRRAGLPVRLIVTGAPPPDPALGLTVYRIVQESITNALRHARSVREVTVAVSWGHGEVTIAIEDAALAPSPSARVGRGILGMKERAALYGGSVEAGPTESGGWRVVARLHWEERA